MTGFRSLRLLLKIGTCARVARGRQRVGGFELRGLLGIGLIALLAGCGADGEPEAPTMNGHIGVANGNLYGAASIGVNRGPVTITIGTGRGCYGCY